jgi:L-lactate dehydrogenase complex protein LldE
VRAALFITCLDDVFFPRAGEAVTRVLERLGCDVAFPFSQACCGQMHFNTGYRDACLPMVETFAQAFAPYPWIVSPSASCVAMVRDHYPELAEATGDATLVRTVRDLVGRVFEFTAFLTDVLGVTDVGAAFAHRVAYHPTCHSLRALRLGDRPLRLLRAVRGLELASLDDAETCCGFGGTFAVKQPAVSGAMLADKMRAVLESRAEVLTAVDMSCLMHIGGGLRRLRAGVDTMHVAEILAQDGR